MIFKINYSDENIKKAINELELELKKFNDKRCINIDIVKSTEFSISYNDNKFLISYKRINDIYFSLSYILGLKINDVTNGYKIVFNRKIENLTFMADCSRNSVLKVETVKRLIRYLALYGYNQLMLYTEDTYVVEEYPYFGYLRNPYTKEEIKEIESYASIFNIELIPCIQTLAHFTALYSQVYFEKMFDINDILLVDNDKTYAFIEALIKACRSYFNTNKIHIGLDEATLTGRGRYLESHEYQDRFTLISRHLSKVLEICKKYDFKPMMWSDMFVDALLKKKADPSFDISKISKDVELIYWNYFSMDSSEYYDTIKLHKELDNDIGFAGAAWKWLGFSPDNRFSFVHLKESFKAVNAFNLKDYIVTAWGDNGAESSIFSILPSILYASMASYERYEIDDIFKAIFNETVLINYDDFITIDLLNRTSFSNDPYERTCANKYLLYNDPLLGRLDTTINVDIIQNVLNKNSSIINNVYTRSINNLTNKWNYIFRTQNSLANVLRIKANLGNNLRTAYKENNTQKLHELTLDIKELLKLINTFKNDFRKEWNIENKPNGIDVFDLRIGALIERLKVTCKYLNNYLNGKIDRIPELEEELLDFLGNGNNFKKDYNQCEYRWRRLTSVNINE